jgi:hypothetical protein
LAGSIWCIATVFFIIFQILPDSCPQSLALASAYFWRLAFRLVMNSVLISAEKAPLFSLKLFMEKGVDPPGDGYSIS